MRESDLRLHERAQLSASITEDSYIGHALSCSLLTSSIYIPNRWRSTTYTIYSASFWPYFQLKMHITHLSTLTALLGSSEAFFRMSCPGRLVRERLDPIINPGGVASHVHTISGGAAFTPTMAYQNMRAANCSTCTIKVCPFLHN